MHGLSDWGRVNPRYLEYCKAHGLTPDGMMEADVQRYPGGKMTGYICWIGARWHEFCGIMRVSADYPMGEKEHTAFDAWLKQRVVEMGVHQLEAA